MGEYLALVMFPALLLALFLGFHVAFSMMGIALVFGYLTFDAAVIFQFAQKIDAVGSNFVLAAVPLFIFMGAMLERSGIAEQLFEAVHLWTRRLPGGLAVGTVVMCVIFAASTGVIGATETVVGLLAIPVMMRVRLRQGADLRHDLRRRLARARSSRPRSWSSCSDPWPTSRSATSSSA